jgi:hypothetical protein
MTRYGFDTASPGRAAAVAVEEGYSLTYQGIAKSLMGVDCLRSLKDPFISKCPSAVGTGRDACLSTVLPQQAPAHSQG